MLINAPKPKSYENTFGRPTWSPDGTQIAAELGRKTVIVRREDMQITARLGPEDSWTATPDWSPDGERIAYAAYTTPEGEELPRWGVYSSKPDGSEVKELSEDAWEPEFSPQGDKVAFMTHKKGEEHVAVVNADGSNERWLSPDGILQMDLSWDPRGQQVTYDHWGDGGPQLRVSDHTGRKDRMLTNGEGGAFWDRNPEWSPDGSQILFERHDMRFPVCELWAIDPQTGKDKKVGDLSGRNMDPAWSPDGSRIAFVSNADGGDLDLYVMNADGSEVKQLSDLNGDEHAPAWSPDGESIAFLRLDWDKKGDDRNTLHVVDV